MRGANIAPIHVYPRFHHPTTMSTHQPPPTNILTRLNVFANYFELSGLPKDDEAHHQYSGERRATNGGSRRVSRTRCVFFSSLSITLNFYYLQLDHMYRNDDESPRHVSPANLRRMGFQTHPRRVLGIFFLLF